MIAPHRLTADQIKAAQEAPYQVSRYCFRCNVRFLVIGEIRSASIASLTCSEACRKAVARKRQRSPFRSLACAVAYLLEGRPVPIAPPYWQLFIALIRRERALIRARSQAEQLPGAARGS